MAVYKRVNLAAEVAGCISYLRARGVLERARRATANTPLARGAGDLGVVSGFVEGMSLALSPVAKLSRRGYKPTLP